MTFLGVTQVVSELRINQHIDISNIMVKQLFCHFIKLTEVRLWLFTLKLLPFT